MQYYADLIAAGTAWEVLVHRQPAGFMAAIGGSRGGVRGAYIGELVLAPQFCGHGYGEHLSARTYGVEPVVRDHRRMESALARPRASAFGRDAYSDLEHKAAALLHSLARNHAPVDSNKRLALAATLAFLGINGRRLTLTNDEAYDFVIAVAVGSLDDVSSIADVLTNDTEPRQRN